MNGLGHRIRELRQKRGIPQAVLAEELEISRSAIAMWENDHREPPLDMLTRIAALLHVSLAELLTGSAAPDIAPVQTRKVPLLRTAEPMPPLESAPQTDIDEAGCDIVLRIADDSMSPTLLPGDTVFIRHGEDAADGQIVALLHEGKLCLKRIYHAPGRCTLLCDNPRFAPVSLSQPQIIGTAVSYRRSLLR